MQNIPAARNSGIFKTSQASSKHPQIAAKSRKIFLNCRFSRLFGAFPAGPVEQREATWDASEPSRPEIGLFLKRPSNVIQMRSNNFLRLFLRQSFKYIFMRSNKFLQLSVLAKGLEIYELSQKNIDKISDKHCVGTWCMSFHKNHRQNYW